jgi:hypothetical protein
MTAHVSEQHIDFICADSDADAQEETARCFFANLNGGRSRKAALGDTSLCNV